MQNSSTTKPRKNIKPYFNSLKSPPKKIINSTIECNKDRSLVNIYRFGQHDSRFNTGTNVQIYEDIKNECQKSNTLWKDALFPANIKSLFYTEQPHLKIEWRRPLDIDCEAKFLVDKYFRIGNEEPEMLGDSWLLGAITNLSLHSELLAQVVPVDQNFLKKQYCGVFHFRFWQYGKWVEVVIDDQLPTCKGKLIYMGITKNHEFWGALLEKAYAKLHGSYEALKEGTIGEAMEDFTGGLCETFNISNFGYPPDLFEYLLKAHEMSSIITCSIPQYNSSNKDSTPVTPEGLVRGLVYIVTCVKEVSLSNKNKEKTTLLRLRNTWCKQYDWNGSWSIKSHEWYCVLDVTKAKMGLVFQADGEFWMCFPDFTKHFSNINICYLQALQSETKFNKKQTKITEKKNWEFASFHGEWVTGISAGGSQNYKETFHSNPQYTLVLNNEGDAESKYTVLVALLQKNKQKFKPMGHVKLHTGIAIFQLAKGLSKPLNMLYFQSNPSLLQSAFIPSREIILHLKLGSGTYCVIPSTSEPGQEGQFFFRVVSDRRFEVKENEEDIMINKINEKVMKPLTPQIEQLFLKRRGKYKSIDWRGLKDILDYAMVEGYGGFSKEACRSMIAMMDANYTGRLERAQFEALWGLINRWKDCFKLFDKKNAYVLDLFDFRQALHSVGCVINVHILNILVRQYGSPEGYITFDDFIMCLVRLRTLIALYNANDIGKTNNVSLSLEKWLENTVYS